MEAPHASPIRLPATKHVCGRTHVNNAFFSPPLLVELLDFRQVSPPPRPLTHFCGPVHKSSAPRTGLSGPRKFHGPHTEIFRSSTLSGLTFLIASSSQQAHQHCFPRLIPRMVSKFCFPVWHRSLAGQFGLACVEFNLNDDRSSA